MTTQVERVRAATAVREGLSWACVTIAEGVDANAPLWRCHGCGLLRTSGGTRLVDHLLGRNNSAKCTGNAAEFLGRVDKVKVRNEEDAKSVKKQKIVILLYFRPMYSMYFGCI